MANDFVGENGGVLVQATIAGDLELLKSLVATEDVNAPDENGWTALHIAARNGNVEIIRLLLAQADLDVNAKNKWNSTPLMIAAGTGNLDVLDLLLQHPKIAIDMQAEYYKRTALIEAAVQGHLSAVKMLIAHGANVNQADKTGRNSALIEAIKNGHYNVCIFLLRSGLIDFSDRDLRLQAVIWCGSRGNEVLGAELRNAIRKFFNQEERAAS